MIRTENINQNFKRAEPYIFALFILLAALFFFRHKFFPTLDGPAHLYNSRLLIEFWFGNSGELSHYLELNPDILPNYTSHILLAFFNLFLPANTAEKIYLAFYLTGFCYSFRYLVFSFPGANPFAALLALPFACSAFLFFGFYNFTLAFIFLLLSLGWWQRMKNNSSPKKWIVLCILLLITYFSHLLMFAVTGALLFASAVWEFPEKVFFHKEKFRDQARTSLKKVAALLFVLLPGIYLVYLYKASRPEPWSVTLPPEEITESFLNASGFVALSHIEIPAARLLHWLLLGAVIAILMYRLLTKKSTESFPSAYLLFCALGLILLAYIVPDSDTRGGFVIQRIVLLSGFLVAVWIALQKIPVIPQVLFVLVFTAVHFKMMDFRTSHTGELSRSASSVAEAGRQIEPYSVVLPVSKTSNWLMLHHSNYMGGDNPLIILENYEAAQDYFPLKFRSVLPVPHYQGAGIFCASHLPSMNSGEKEPDYVFILGSESILASECDSTLNLFLKNRAELKYSSQFCSLYKVDNSLR